MIKMINDISGFNVSLNFDFNDTIGQNLKALDEKEASNLTSARSNSAQTESINYHALDQDVLDESKLAVWAQNVEFAKLNDKQKTGFWL